MNVWDDMNEAWSLLWNKRSLWFFGLLAALGGGGFNFIWRIGETQSPTELPLGSRALLQNVLSPLDPPTLILVGVVLGGAMFMLHTLAQGALIRMVGLWLRHQPATLRDGVRAAWHYFLPLLAVRFLLALPLVLAGMLTAHSIVPALAGLFTEPTGERLVTLGQAGQLAGLSIPLVALSLLIAAIDIGAERAVVLDDSPIGRALLQSVKALWHNFLDYIVIGLTFLVLGVIVGLTFVVLLAPIFFVDTLTVLSHGVDQLNAFTFTTSALGPLALVVLVLALVLGTLVTVFTANVWTIAYEDWQSKRNIWALA